MDEKMAALEKQHNEMLYTSVRVGAKNAGGSGTVLYSQDGLTYVLTNHHVIESLYDWDEKPNPMTGKLEYIENRSMGKIDFFQYDDMSTMVGTTGHRSTLEAYNEQDDLALMKLQTKNTVDHVAHMYPRGKESEIKMFEKVWAVGCSLGHPTTFSEGHITGKSDEIDDRMYWMSSAPIIFGNSGGSVFIDRDDQYQFIGVPSRVSVAGFGSAVSHMGYLIPPDRVYNFLEKQQFQFIYDEGFTPAECEKKRKFVKDKQKQVLEDLLNEERENVV